MQTGLHGNRWNIQAQNQNSNDLYLWMYNINEYNGKVPAMKPGKLNQFKNPIEACAVASGLDRELISFLTIHLNQYAHGNVTTLMGHLFDISGQPGQTFLSLKYVISGVFY